MAKLTENQFYMVGLLLTIITTAFICMSFYALYRPPLLYTTGDLTQNLIAPEEGQDVETEDLVVDPGYAMQSPSPSQCLPQGIFRDIPIVKQESMIGRQKGPVIVVTHEPYESTSTELRKVVDGKPVLFLNAFTGIIYQNASLYSPNGPPLDAIAVAEMASRKLKQTPNIAYFGTYRGTAYTSQYPDLRARQELALYGHEKGWVRIMGHGWPFKVSHDSRGEPMQKRYLKQLSILRDSYAFSIASENSIAPSYITEKIWAAIEGHTLPIYTGGNGIEKIFEPDSFVDTRKFATPDALFAFLRKMTHEEYRQRMIKCVKAFNEQRNKYKQEQSDTATRVTREMEKFATEVTPKARPRAP